MNRSWRWTALVGVLAVVTAPGAPASADTWAIVPVTTGGAAPPAEIASVAAASIESTGATVLQAPQLTHRAENELSLPFTAAPAGLIDRLLDAELHVPERIADRRYELAIQQTDALFAELEAHLAAVNRDDHARAKLANLCGYRVRAFVEARDTSGAATAAQTCYRLQPAFTPNRELHPPAILERLDAARSTLGASLVVQTGEDDPAHCAIRVNGVRVGTSPSARVAVPAGTYAVQVECGSTPGRVHRVSVESGEATLRVRGTLDAALQTGPVSLVYATTEAQATLAGDLAALGRALGADRVLAVVGGGPSPRLEVYEVPLTGPATRARVTVLERTDEGHVREAARALGNPSLAAAPAGSSVSPIGPLMLGAGGAVLVAGVLVGAIALAEDGALGAACPSRLDCAPELMSRSATMTALAATADVLLTVGAAAAITGLVLTLTLTEGGGDVPATAYCTPDGCGAAVRGRF
ncbi:MAG: hypothetical protein IT378_25695 [Sandaracinaceae bacterium]|nr:hypothetical protein [Sandaracinaceae bacterium]